MPRFHFMQLSDAIAISRSIDAMPLFFADDADAIADAARAAGHYTPIFMLLMPLLIFSLFAIDDAILMPLFHHTPLATLILLYAITAPPFDISFSFSAFARRCRFALRRRCHADSFRCFRHLRRCRLMLLMVIYQPLIGY